MSVSLWSSIQEWLFLPLKPYCRILIFKRDRIKEIYENKNIKTLDTSTRLYEFFENKEFKEKMIRMFIS